MATNHQRYDSGGFTEELSVVHGGEGRFLDFRSPGTLLARGRAGEHPVHCRASSLSFPGTNRSIGHIDEVSEHRSIRLLPPRVGGGAVVTS